MTLLKSLRSGPLWTTVFILIVHATPTSKPPFLTTELLAEPVELSVEIEPAVKQQEALPSQINPPSSNYEEWKRAKEMADFLALLAVEMFLSPSE